MSILNEKEFQTLGKEVENYKYEYLVVFRVKENGYWRHKQDLYFAKEKNAKDKIIEKWKKEYKRRESELDSIKLVKG